MFLKKEHLDLHRQTTGHKGPQKKAAKAATIAAPASVAAPAPAVAAPKHSCRRCLAAFDTKALLKVHLDTSGHRGDPPHPAAAAAIAATQSFACRNCSSVFGTKKLLKGHLDATGHWEHGGGGDAGATETASAVAVVPRRGAGACAVGAGVASAQFTQVFANGDEEVHVMRTTREKVEQEVEASMGIHFLLDLSGSMSGEKVREMERQLINIIFDSDVIKPHDSINIAGFNHSRIELLGWTRRRKITREDIASLNITSRASGGTALYDQIEESLKMERAFRAENTKKRAYIILVLTDGSDVSSEMMTAETLRASLRTPRIPDFHFNLLGVKLPERAQSTISTMVAGIKHAKFTDTSEGTAANAISEGFRTHFTCSINMMRVQYQSLHRTTNGDETVVTARRREALVTVADAGQVAATFRGLALGVFTGHQGQGLLMGPPAGAKKGGRA